MPLIVTVWPLPSKVPANLLISLPFCPMGVQSVTVMLAPSLKYLPLYTVPLFTSVASLFSSASVVIMYGSASVPEPVQTPSAAHALVHRPSAMTSARMVANNFFMSQTPFVLDFRRTHRFKIIKTQMQRYLCG